MEELFQECWYVLGREFTKNARPLYLTNHLSGMFFYPVTFISTCFLEHHEQVMPRCIIVRSPQCRGQDESNTSSQTALNVPSPESINSYSSHPDVENTCIMQNIIFLIDKSKLEETIKHKYIFLLNSRRCMES